MNNPEAFELLAYMATSAAGLKGEPKIYGPLRLIESCQKLVSIILQEDADNENLKELQAHGMLPLFDAGYVNLSRQYLTIGVNLASARA